MRPAIFGIRMFQVLHSSAGAGKTHALVKHYQGHCLGTDDHGAYRHVLALTFTNKAAGEMKERVIQYLGMLAAGHVEDGRIKDLLHHITTMRGATEQEIQERARRCLKHMLHHWSDVAISTIDSFTRKVVRPFARDLQLDHDLNMTTEEDHYRALAVEALIAEAGHDDRITELLSEVCSQLLHEERKWDPEKPLLELSGELSKESSIGPLQKLRNMDPATVAPLAERLRTGERMLRRQVNALGETALALIRDAGIAVEEMAYGRNGIISYFKKLCAFQEDWDPPGSNTLKVIENDKWHSSKAGPASMAALERISGELLRIFQEAEKLREEKHRDHVIKRAVLRELLPSYALHELDLRLEQVKARDAVAFFSDLTRRVSEVVKGEPVPFIYERLGERYRHFLIDEFQDTSIQQWNALLPLIDNALGSGGSALLVGDAKQAIYRWRNGEVRLFQHFPELFGRDDDPASMEREKTLRTHFMEGEKLAFNYRSASTIINFNNTLFDELKCRLPASLISIYDDHQQEIKRMEPGLVQLQVLPKELKGEARVAEIQRSTLEAVENAIADGFAPGDIAILVRGRNLGRTVAEHLIAHGHSVVSPDGLRLSGDPVIELLIDQLRFLHTQDPAAAARIAQFKGMLEATAEQGAVEWLSKADGLPSPVALLEQWLADHDHPQLRTTIAALIGELARANGLRPGDDAQILTLQDEAHAWTTAHGQDIGGFLEHWERSGGQRSVEPPDNGQAVQVMTVHRSKGLQFPVVIVPNACMSTRGDHGERIWVDPGDAVPELDVALVRNSKSLRSAGLQEIEEETGLSMLDALDLLYVAFTRPEQRLHALVPEAGADAVTEGLLEYIGQHGEQGCLIIGERMRPWSTRSTGNSGTITDVGGDPRKTTLELRLEAPADWQPADPDPYRSHGNLVHDLLAQVEHAGDLPLVIERALLSGDLSPEQGAQLHTRLAPMLSSAELRPYFGDQLQVRSECSILLKDGGTLRPDRVVEDEHTIRVLDIKTGKPSDAHVEQVRTYMHHLAELTGKQAEGALFYVRDGSLLPVKLNEHLVQG